MSQMIQIPYKDDVSVPHATAQAVQKKGNENPLSLEALGLLVNLLSYPHTWELHKTELYKRFGKNKETSVKSAWNDLMENNYIIEFKYRVGKKWEYVYYFRKVPFTTEEKAKILDNAEKEYDGIWELDFQDLKMKTSKPRVNQKDILNINNKYKNTNNNYIENIDDKRTFPAMKDSTGIHNEESIDLIIRTFREVTKDDIADRTYKTVVRKVVDKYNQGAIGKGKFRDYLATALTNKIKQLETRRIKDHAKKQITFDREKRLKDKIKRVEITPDVPFYNWLEE